MENQIFNQLVELAKENHDPASRHEIEIYNDLSRYSVKYYCKPNEDYNYLVWVYIDYTDEKFTVGVAPEGYGYGSADYIEEIDTIDEAFEEADRLVYSYEPEDFNYADEEDEDEE